MTERSVASKRKNRVSIPVNLACKINPNVKEKRYFFSFQVHAGAVNLSLTNKTRRRQHNHAKPSYVFSCINHRNATKPTYNCIALYT